LSASSGLYADPECWARKVVLNVAGSARFSSDPNYRRMRGWPVFCVERGSLLLRKEEDILLSHFGSEFLHSQDPMPGAVG